MCLLFTLPAFAQQQDTVVPTGSEPYIIIKKVIVEGNKKTRPSIIQREVRIQPGDTIYYKDLANTLEAARKQVLNTSLFLAVNTNIRNWEGNQADFVVDVAERWYTIALPVFKLADRNFNVWWVDQKRSLNRVNLGVRGFQDNLTGRGDKLSMEVQVGYTQKVLLGYTLPYIDKKLRHGVGFLVSYSRSREINDSTNLNKQVFFRQDEFLREVSLFALTYSFRPAINARHQVWLSYNTESVADTIAKRNPSYLGDGRTKAKYLELLYRFNYIDADSWIYPLKGTSFQGEIAQAGFFGLADVKYTKLRVKATQYWQLQKKWYAAVGARVQARFPSDQPYFMMKGMGYNEDYLRGLEYYVVDGTNFAIAKTTLRYELLSFNVHLPLIPKKFRSVPFRIYGKAYADGGYSYNKFPGNSFLNERFLYTGGIGLDIVSFYDTCLRIEYSANQFGQKGLFLHTKIDM